MFTAHRDPGLLIKVPHSPAAAWCSQTPRRLMKVTAVGRAAAVSLLSGWTSNIFHSVLFGSLSVNATCRWCGKSHQRCSQRGYVEAKPVLARKLETQQVGRTVPARFLLAHCLFSVVFADLEVQSAPTHSTNFSSCSEICFVTLIRGSVFFFFFCTGGL